MAMVGCRFLWNSLRIVSRSFVPICGGALIPLLPLCGFLLFVFCIVFSWCLIIHEMHFLCSTYLHAILNRCNKCEHGVRQAYHMDSVWTSMSSPSRHKTWSSTEVLIALRSSRLEPLVHAEGETFLEETTKKWDFILFHFLLGNSSVHSLFLFMAWHVCL